MLVENLPVPFDRRVWQEAGTLRDAGYAVSVISPAGPGCPRGYTCIDGIHVYRYRQPFEASGPAGYLLEYAAALLTTLVLALRIAFTRGFDVIHACNPPDLFFLIGALFRTFGKRFVFDHHDICPELFEAKFGRRGPWHRLLVTLERLSFRTADVAIATNDSYRHIAIARGGMPAARVFVVRSGPSAERLQIRPPEPRWRHGRRYLVGYVGVIGAQEGIDLLLRAVRHVVLRLQRRDIHFVIVGGGTHLAPMQDLAARLQVAEYVTFTGRVPDAELLAVLNTADVCVNPDPANEMNDKSTMNKILEYMALGKPIVQFDLREGRRSAGESSLYARRNDTADFAQQLVALLDDPKRRARMGAFGRRRVLEELAWNHQAPKLLAAYSALWNETGVAARETAAT
ncbi:MAG: glycosyltransferase family 4 protein [Steroidobacteraceae bacterium]